MHVLAEDATIYVGNITDQCNEELLWELFVQVGKFLEWKNLFSISARTRANSVLSLDALRLFFTPKH
jgi:hypothetical protein